jgi:hypothetical protein
MTTMPEPELSAAAEWISPTRAAMWQQFIVQAYDFGLLDREQAREMLRGYVLQDADGGAWTVRSDSGVWFRRDPEGRWVEAEPPDRLRPPSIRLSRIVREENETPGGAPEHPAGARAFEVAATAPEPAKLSRRPDSCPQCGSHMPGKKFCTNCGASLGS